MKSYRWIVVGVIVCLLVAIGAYVWAMGLMDSLFAYRSPLHENPPSPGAPLGGPATRRVVFVLLDALREDTSLRPDVMPFLNTLRESGAWATMHSKPPSYSQPSYTTLLTGAWPDISDGPALNVDYEEIPAWTQDNLFSAAHRTGLETAVSGFYWFEKLIPQSAVSVGYYTAGEDHAADRAVVDTALPWLDNGGYQLVLIHIDQIDYAGHYEGGPLDPRWDAAARRADDLLREIAVTLDLEQDTLFVCSDHGQIDQGGHGGQDPVVLIEPWVLVGAGVRPGHYDDVEMVDVAPTLAALLGTNIPASSQGHVRTEMLDLDAGQLNAVQEGLAAQQSALLEAYQAAVGRRTPVNPGNDVVVSHQAALEVARSTRLNAERLPRLLLALMAVILLGAALFRMAGRDVVWFLGGAGLYVIVFNLRYAVLNGQTYSLSSVYSADGLIMYVAATASIAVVFGWLFVSLGKRVFRDPPRLAAETSAKLTLTKMYLLSLPVFWSFVANGVVAIWTIPDFTSTFVGFLSLLQLLIVSAIGLLLAGLAALISAANVWVGQKRRQI